MITQKNDTEYLLDEVLELVEDIIGNRLVDHLDDASDDDCEGDYSCTLCRAKRIQTILMGE